MMALVTLLLLALPGQATLPAERGGALVGGDPCALVEGVPGPKDPLREVRRFRAGFRAMERAGADAERLAKAHRELRAALVRLLAEGEKLFQGGAGSGERRPRWQDAKTKKARAWLQRWVMGPSAPLRIGEVGFEPSPGLRAALMLTACRGRDPEAAIRLGRRARGDDEGSARALAALLLLTAGRDAEARELSDELGDEGFLAPYVGAWLSEDPEVRRRLAATARRRVTTPAQEDAVRAQARHLDAVTP
ncbi:MAG: hypothetical protein H6744_16065 [Deltaproteobacteria bacterium]|nr:hypothetical protein [Deltaproteobacteria bacterium]MCB9788198.1 hypothetical protein [Deltaproteobacteria bacterium]